MSPRLWTVCGRDARLEIEGPVQPAAFVEPGVARRAGGHRLVCRDRQLGAAHPAQDRLRLATAVGPLPGRVSDGLVMAVEAGVVRAATGELDRDDVRRTVVMRAARLVVDGLAEHHGSFHTVRLYEAS